MRSTLATTVSPSRSSDEPTGKGGLSVSLQAPTTVALSVPSYWTTHAPGSPSSRPTFSVTCWNTRLGADSAATTVATLRSAACSSANARWIASLSANARAARVRSAVTAASSRDVSAAVAMKTCVASRLSVIDSRTKGPVSCAVFHTVIEQTTMIAVAAPRGPGAAPPRAAPGNTM